MPKRATHEQPSTARAGPAARPAPRGGSSKVAKPHLLESRAAKSPRRKRAAASEPKLSRLKRPTAMPTIDWQRALRRQFGREQGFELQPPPGAVPFGRYVVVNPLAASRHRVAIRGLAAGDNRCSCADFRSNELGTCKHIEFALHRLMKRRGAKAAFARGWTPATSELWLHHGEQRSVRWCAAADAPGQVLKLAASLFEGPDQVLPPGHIGELYAFIAAARRAGHALEVEDEVLDHAARLRDAEHRQAVLDAAYPQGARDRGLAKLLKTRLYPYQAEGALFAARAGRALIADEMGLGKTVQALGAMELLVRHFGVQRVLVICPTSLKQQWRSEIERFTGRSATSIGGNRVKRTRGWREEAFCKIVNYDALAADGDLIDAWAPELMIVDEAQRVKNWNTLAARAIRHVQAPYAVVLTGTPLENRLDELIAIVQLVDPHRLGPTWRLREQHQITDDSGRVIGYRELHRLGATLAPVMLRRRKAEVLLQLPERIDKTLFVPLTPKQREHHDENGLVVARIVARWRKTGFLSDSDQRRLQCALQNMRMSCNSTWLLDGETDHGTKADELVALLEDLLEDPAAKAVVFSQWLGTHEVILRRTEGRGWGHVHFHGSVPGEQRGALIERFHQDPQCRLFLATDAGGVGLNLQHAAAVVINMDLPWNPAVLEQRIGRVHRMGQRRGVQVVNFVAQGSIEEGIIGVLGSKKALASGILDGGADEVLMQGTGLARFMAAVDEVTAGMAAVEPEVGIPAEEAAEAAAPVESGAFEHPVASDPSDGPAQTAGTAQTARADEGMQTMPPKPDSEARAANPWVPLLQAGLGLLGALTEGGPNTHPWVAVDPASGKRELRVPLPEPAVARGLAEALAAWLTPQRPG